ncbi:MAG TPA: class I SAM-dependent methyltransferase [Ktedonobacteraceae bacterium]|nr:class I SAM-dependent methyltransferase [Ktedonobacteraceae bacterium]
MSTLDNSPDENTYFIDAENAAEMARLTTQDRLTTKGMGGLFPAQSDLSGVRDVLDIACGPGGWVLDVAQAYPDKQVMGVDISRLMVEYAKAQAREKSLSNAHFQVMDALKPLGFPDNSFDMVNARFISGFLPRAIWPGFIKETMRITRSGGIICLTESEWNLTNSQASEKIMGLLARALQTAGLSFSPDGRHVGITPMLGRLLRDGGCTNVQSKAHMVDFSWGMEGHTSNYQNSMVFFKLIQPFLINAHVTTKEEVEQLYQQALMEMQSEDFTGIFFFLSAWGNKPS